MYGVPPIIAATLLAIAVSTGVSAQSGTNQRPYRGLFKGGMAQDAARSLVANASIGGGWDDNILLDVPGQSSDPRIGQRGSVGSLNGSLSYATGGDRGSLGASIGSSLRYYPSQQTSTISSHGGMIGGSLRLGSRTTLSGSQTVSYQPFTFISVVPALTPQSVNLEPTDLGASVAPAFLLDQSTSAESYLAHASSVAMAHQLTRRVGAYASYTLQQSETAFTGGSFRNNTASAGFTVRLSRDLSARLGYTLQEARLTTGGRTVRSNNADVGLNYGRGLSLSRRTSLSFATGTSAISSGDRRSYQLVGSVGLTHELGRTWTALAGYSRSVQLIDLLLLPIISDSIQASVQGLVTRRVQAQAGFGTSIGTVGFGRRDGPTSGSAFDTQHAFANISYALTRFAQLGTSYAFYRYRFDDAVALPQGVPNKIDRQSIRAYLNLWAPVINRARR